MIDKSWLFVKTQCNAYISNKLNSGDAATEGVTLVLRRCIVRKKREPVAKFAFNVNLCIIYKPGIGQYI